jgi:hypothetical protein
MLSPSINVVFPNETIRLRSWAPYIHPARTIVWLGTATEDTVENMQGMSRAFERKIVEGKVFTEEDLILLFDHYRQGYLDLVTRPYWNRV